MSQPKIPSPTRFVVTGLLSSALAMYACSAPPAPINVKSAIAGASNVDDGSATADNGGTTGSGDATGTTGTTTSDTMGSGTTTGSTGTSTTTADTTMGTIGTMTAGTMTTTATDAAKFTPCVDQSDKCHPHRMIMSDWALGKVIHVNLDDPSKDWDLMVPGGARDLQLIGNNKLLVSTSENSNGPWGWHEVDLDTGKIVKSVVGLTSTVMAAQRIPNGNTLLIGPNLLGGNGAVVIETNDKKEIISRREFPGQENFRVVRRTREGHFLLGNHGTFNELTVDGQNVFHFDGGAEPSYMALKLPNGERWLANGHGGTIFHFDAAGNKALQFKLPDIDSISGMKGFASAFLLLPNGNIVTTSWSGSGPDHGKDGPQVSEYNQKGERVWSWKQQANRISTVYAVLVLDNLDLSKAYDDTAGPLAPIQTPYP